MTKLKAVRNFVAGAKHEIGTHDGSLARHNVCRRAEPSGLKMVGGMLN